MWFSLVFVAVCGLFMHGDTQSLLDFDGTAEYACGETLEAGVGVIESPFFPDWYPANADCTWQITAPSDGRINLTSQYFSLEYQSDCLWDYLIIVDRLEGEYKQWKFCGSDPVQFLSSSNGVLVHFRSDASEQDVGFRIAYEAILPQFQRDPGCNLTLWEEGNLTSPRYPYTYPPNLECYYHIQAPENSKVRLEFTYFSVETSPCDFDRLEIYDGTSVDDGKLLGVLCGREMPAVFTSQSSTMILKFTSDERLEHRGFKAKVTFVIQKVEDVLPASSAPHSPQPTTSSTPAATLETGQNTSVMSASNRTLLIGNAIASRENPNLRNSTRESGCNRTVKTSSANISSPGFPRNYPPDVTCVTRLRSDVISSYLLTFVNFSIEEWENCDYDSLSIYQVDNASDIGQTLLRRMCGSVLSDPIVSFEGYGLDLVFRSDMSVSDIGFWAQVVIAPLVQGEDCPAKCQHGGTCVQTLLDDGSVDWMCVCAETYTGVLCEQQVRETCDVIKCQNNGICRDDGVVASCVCSNRSSGQFCQDLSTAPINGSLYFTKMVSNMSLSVGSSAILECAVNDPAAHVMWLFKDRIMTNSDWSRGVEVHPGGVVVIPEVKDEHSGRYTCMVVTSGDLLERSIWIHLTEPCGLYVSKAPLNTTVREGQTAMFQCYVPDADVLLWRKDGDIIESGPRKRILVNNYLVIHSVLETDAGQYTCAARARNGCFARVTAYLIVESMGHREECGRPRTRRVDGGTGRISSGKEALPGTAPWHVILREDREKTTFCGGSLISRDTVLTAAHCVAQFEMIFGYPFHPSHIQIFLGTHHCAGHNGIYRQLKSYVLHENFNDTNYNNDVAIFKLDRPVDYIGDIMPICLETPEFLEELVKPGRLGVITGCGGRFSHGSVPTYLHEVQIPYVSRDVCRERAAAVKTTFTDGMFCAGYARSMRGDACSGDSGGAYIIEFSGRSIQVGIISWGVGCDREDHYGYYSSIGHYYNWIMEKMGRQN